MKKLLTILAAASISFSAWAAAEIKITESNHDFGNIKAEAGPVECEFEIENTGDSPLVILSATSECGCTKPKYPLQPLKPGEKGIISVSFNPLGYSGEFTKVVKVKTNAPKKKNLRLKISGVVIPSN